LEVRDRCAIANYIAAKLLQEAIAKLQIRTKIFSSRAQEPQTQSRFRKIAILPIPHPDVYYDLLSCQLYAKSRFPPQSQKFFFSGYAIVRGHA